MPSTLSDAIEAAIAIATLLAITAGLASAQDFPAEIAASVATSERAATQALATATGWQPEVTLPDSSRADLIGPDHAAEVEWSDKWKESIGQAVLYAILADRRPAVVLLSRGDDRVEVLRCRLVCERVGVRMWVVRVR